LLAQQPWIAPIPGTTKTHRLNENVDSVNVELSVAELQRIDEVMSVMQFKGDRYPEHLQKMVGR